MRVCLSLCVFWLETPLDPIQSNAQRAGGYVAQLQI